MGLSLTILGSCGSYPGPGLACSGYLLRTPATTVWMDAGSGTLANLQRHVALDEIDAIVITHEHPDHWGDLAGYHVAAKHMLDLDTVAVYAPAGVREHTYYSGAPFVWHDITDGSSEAIGDMRLTFSRTDHPPETLGVRVEDGEGRALGYSADSGPGWSLTALGPGLDLALCEATYPSDSEGSGHMTARQAGSSAKDAGAARLVLTHVAPGGDRDERLREGRAAFGGEVHVAAEHEVYEV